MGIIKCKIDFVCSRALALPGQGLAQLLIIFLLFVYLCPPTYIVGWDGAYKVRPSGLPLAPYRKPPRPQWTHRATADTAPESAHHWDETVTE
ncbi:hypothetical protein [Gloeothece citriformis]|uniref:hypothetical protein n=1 Tax=Gloeothece citriformis TaxID=2546356 RepID=UPI00059CF76F|nr:hypothetical protein [Gloeothece citriformis]